MNFRWLIYQRIYRTVNNADADAAACVFKPCLFEIRIMINIWVCFSRSTHLSLEKTGQERFVYSVIKGFVPPSPQTLSYYLQYLGSKLNTFIVILIQFHWRNLRCSNLTKCSDDGTGRRAGSMHRGQSHINI